MRSVSDEAIPVGFRGRLDCFAEFTLRQILWSLHSLRMTEGEGLAMTVKELAVAEKGATGAEVVTDLRVYPPLTGHVAFVNLSGRLV